MRTLVRWSMSIAVVAASLMMGACSSKRMESASGSAVVSEGSTVETPTQESSRGTTRSLGRKAVASLSVDQEKALQNELMALPEGLITFDAPPALRRGQTVRIEARVARDFVAKLNDALVANKLLRGAQVKNVMGLQLEAPGMKVKPLTTLEQMVGTDPTAPTLWAWEVTPTVLGKNALTLSMILHLQRELGQKQRAYPVLERHVDVQDAKGGFFATYGWWLLALLLVLSAVVLLVKKT